MRFLMVCTGNICRSPMAEGVMRQRIAGAGLADRMQVESAGTHGYHVGDPPDRRAQATAARRGYPIGEQRARRVVPADYDRFDLLVAMDRGHLGLLRQALPSDDRADRLTLLLDHAPGPSGGDVPDPYYGDVRDFEQALDLIERGVDGLIGDLRATGRWPA